MTGLDLEQLAAREPDPKADWQEYRTIGNQRRGARAAIDALAGMVKNALKKVRKA
jgi:hypothetical protein